MQRQIESVAAGQGPYLRLVDWKHALHAACVGDPDCGPWRERVQKVRSAFS